MRKEQGLRLPPFHRGDAAHPSGHVHVGRWGDGHDVVGLRNAHASYIADKGRPAQPVKVTDVVHGMPGGVGHVQHPVGEGERLPTTHHVQVILRHAFDSAPEAVHVVPIDAAGAPQQARWVVHVRRADPLNNHLKLRMLSHQRPSRAGVVQVNVREQHGMDVFQCIAVG